MIDTFVAIQSRKQRTDVSVCVQMFGPHEKDRKKMQQIIFAKRIRLPIASRCMPSYKFRIFFIYLYIDFYRMT